MQRISKMGDSRRIPVAAGAAVPSTAAAGAGGRAAVEQVESTPEVRSHHAVAVRSIHPRGPVAGTDAEEGAADTQTAAADRRRTAIRSSAVVVAAVGHTPNLRRKKTGTTAVAEAMRIGSASGMRVRG